MNDPRLPLAVIFAVAAVLLLIRTVRNWHRPSRKIEERLNRDR